MKWISVKDRLPEEKTYVLVYVKYLASVDFKCNVRHGWLKHPAGVKSEYNFIVPHQEGSEFKYAWEVTHWMPLPPPPKEQT